MQNIVINMCEKFHNDRLRNDRALGNGSLITGIIIRRSISRKKQQQEQRSYELGDPFPDLKINKMPEFCMIFARKTPEFYMIVARKIVSVIVGAACSPSPPSPMPMVVGGLSFYDDRLHLILGFCSRHV